MSLFKNMDTECRDGKIMDTSQEAAYEKTWRKIYCREIYDETMFPSEELENPETREEFLKRLNLKEGFSREEFRERLEFFARCGWSCFTSHDIIDAGFIPQDIADLWRRHFAELYKIMKAVNCHLSKDSSYFNLMDKNIVAYINLGEESDLLTGLVARIGEQKNMWVAEFAYPHYCEYGDEIESHYFSCRPQLSDIVTAVLAHKIDRFFERDATPTIVCQFCHKELHWADIDADSLFERLRMIENSHCGCPRKPRRRRIPK